MAVLTRILLALVALFAAGCTVQPTHGEPIPVTLSDDAGHHVFGMVVPVPQGPAGFDGGGGAAAVGGQYPNGLYVARCDGGEVWLGGDGGGPPHCGSPGTTGAVTSVSGTLPIVSSGGSTPAISIGLHAPTGGGIVIDGGAFELTRCDSGIGLVEGDGGGKAWVCNDQGLTFTGDLVGTGPCPTAGSCTGFVNGVGGYGYPSSGGPFSHAVGDVFLITQTTPNSYAKWMPLSQDCSASGTGAVTCTQLDNGVLTASTSAITIQNGTPNPQNLIMVNNGSAINEGGAVGALVLGENVSGNFPTTSIAQASLIMSDVSALHVYPPGMGVSGKAALSVSDTTVTLGGFASGTAQCTVNSTSSTFVCEDALGNSVALTGSLLASTTQSNQFGVEGGPATGGPSSSVASGELVLYTQNAAAATSGTAAGAASGILVMGTGTGASGLGGTSGGGAAGAITIAGGYGGNATSTGTSGAGAGVVLVGGNPGSAASGTTGVPGSILLEPGAQVAGGVATGAAAQVQTISSSAGAAATFTNELDYQLVGTHNSQNNTIVRKVCNARLTGVSQTTTCTIPQVASTVVQIGWTCIGRTITAGTSGSIGDGTTTIQPTALCSTVSGGTTTCATGNAGTTGNTGTANLAAPACALSSVSNVPTITLTTASNGAGMVVDTQIILTATYD